MRRHRVVVAVAQVVFAGPLHAHGRSDFRASHAASQMKSGFDFRPNAPPNNVTLTVTFASSMPR
jgi:hypothetical protein